MKKKKINRRWLLFLAKAFFDISLFFASAFLGVYLAIHFNEPMDSVAFKIIGLIIMSLIFKASIAYQLDKR